MLIGELHGHTATERVTHHRRPADAEFIEQITQRYRERTQRIVTARLGRFTCPNKSGATTRYFFDNWGNTARQVAELPAIPWINSSASPAPASRYATRSPCSSRNFTSLTRTSLHPMVFRVAGTTS
jgi:hypothetical protein